MKKRTVLILVALFFCFIPFSKVGADTSSGSIPGIDLPDQNTLDDLNNSADDAQKAVDDITDASDEAINKELGDDSTNYELGDDKTPLYVYTSYLDTDNKIKVTVNMGVQGVFYIAKQEYSFTKWIDNMFSKINVVKDYGKVVLASGKTVYDSLLSPSNLSFWLIATFILYSLLRAFLKGHLAKTVIVIFGLLILNSSFFNLGGKVIDTVQTKSADINTSVIEKIKIGGVSNGKPDLLQTMVITPFERMNFDNDKQYGTKSENVNKLINSGGDAGKVADIRKAEKVSHLRFNEIGDKFSVALGAVINNFVLGCGVLLFKLGALIAGIAFLVFLLVAPIVAFLVFLSVFEQAGKNLVVKTGVTLILSVLLGYATTLFLSLNNFLDTIFGGAGANYLFMSIAKVIVYVILFKFRGFFFSVLGNASSAITNNRAFNAMDTTFSRAKQRTLQPILAGGTAGIIAGKTFAKDINYKVGTGAINRRRSENRFKKYGESMKNILDPNSDEKKRNKATKQKERFEKRFEKQNKKAEKKQQNTQTSETKKKRASDKVAPYSDMNKAQPKTETGKNLKDLKQKSEQKVEHDKKLEQLRPATERMVKNTQQNYEKKHQSAESRNQAIVKGVKANQEQKASAQRMAQRFEKNKQRFSPNSNKPTKTSVKQSVKSESIKREDTQINRPTKIKNEL